MSCEAYREGLSDALLRGEAARSEMLATHLRVCPSCAEFYEAQKRLLDAMDSGVRAMVNEEMPASLLPGVRARMEQEESQRAMLPWKIAAVAAAGVLALVTYPLLRHMSRAKNVSPMSIAEIHPQHNVLQSAAAPVSTKPGTSVLQARSASHQHVRQKERGKTDAPEMQVLIDPAEARGLRKLAKAAVQNPEWALAMAHNGELPVLPDESIHPHEAPDTETMPFEKVP